MELSYFLVLVVLLVAGTAVARHFKMKWHLRENPPFDMSHWPSELPPLAEYVAGVRERAATPCTVFTCDRALGTHAGPLATWIGDVVVGAPGETWPERNGRPMVGVCQFNLTQCPAVPPCLEGIALLTMFLERQQRDNHVEWSAANGGTPEEMVIRTYTRLDELIQYADRPTLPNPYKPCAASPALFVEHPEEYAEIEETRGKLGLPESWSVLVRDALRDEELLDGEAVFGTKVGGWPAPIQDFIARPLAFQLGSEDAAGMMWGDAGCVFVWKDGTKWESKIECF